MVTVGHETHTDGLVEIMTFPDEKMITLSWYPVIFLRCLIDADPSGSDGNLIWTGWY